MASPRRLVDLKCDLPWSLFTIFQSYLRRCGIFERIRRRNGNCQLFRLYKRNKLKKIVLIEDDQDLYSLVEYNLELRKRLKDEGLLTRDARAKERKKYGMAGARKRFQFSKR